MEENIITDKFNVVYQPIIDLITKKPIGYESLLRGPIPTEQIINNAIKNGVIHKIDLLSHQLAFENTFMEGKEKLFLNVHPHSLAKIVDVLDSYTSRHSNIVFEIIEHSNFDIQHLSEEIKVIKKAGISIAIDDFGTGYNNLNLLTKLKFDYIKIDREFIQGFKKDINERFVEMIVKWANENNVIVIAEGIETLEHYSSTVDKGIIYGQGYFLGKPQKYKKKELILP